MTPRSDGNFETLGPKHFDPPKTNFFFPPSGPTQSPFQKPSAERKFLAVMVGALAWVVAVSSSRGDEAGGRTAPAPDPEVVRSATGLDARKIDITDFTDGEGPEDFEDWTGVPYRPSYNGSPTIPVQCWIETGYGTQNACKYCHTPELTRLGHGNGWPVEESLITQALYSFEGPNANKVHWDNVIRPDERNRRLQQEGVDLPTVDDADELLRWIRTGNWQAAYDEARPNGDATWNNASNPDKPMRLMPALNPNHLHPYPAAGGDPTGGGEHGYVDPAGFVRDAENGYTGWRAINFLPYAIFTPLSGSVSGIYIRLPEIFRTRNGIFDLETYRDNLDLLVRAIKTPGLKGESYLGDASAKPVKAGLYPVGTEFAHPLHYVDRAADGETGEAPDGVVSNGGPSYEFPGLRSKRVKEVRYSYKWREVPVEMMTVPENEDYIVGKQWQGWVINVHGWILAGYIEDSKGQLRPQTTVEMMQCVGCHGRVGSSVDTGWSLQRKLPGAAGWAEMDYGDYDSARPNRTRLEDYKTRHRSVDKGEME